MLFHRFKQAKKIIPNSFNVALITLCICFPKSSMANFNNNISHLIQSREQSLQELYQINNIKINNILLAVDRCHLLEKESGIDKNQSGYLFDLNKETFLFDLNKETFDLGLQLAKSHKKKIAFLEKQLEKASSIEIFYHDIYLIGCVSKLPMILSKDFIFKIQIQLVEEKNNI